MFEQGVPLTVRPWGAAGVSLSRSSIESSIESVFLQSTVSDSLRSDEADRLEELLESGREEAPAVRNHRRRCPVHSYTHMLMLTVMLLGMLLLGLSCRPTGFLGELLPEQAELTLGSDACLDVADQYIWHTGGRTNFGDQMSLYGKKCLGYGSCVASHMAKGAGYSQGCANCFGDMAGCSASHCAIPCTLGGGKVCNSCVERNCRAAMRVCTGFAD